MPVQEEGKELIRLGPKHLTWRYSDRQQSKWGQVAGDWNHELIDQIQVEDTRTRYILRIDRHRDMGHFCGYVALPAHHPLCAVDDMLSDKTYVLQSDALGLAQPLSRELYDQVSVHGGITFHGQMHFNRIVDFETAQPFEPQPYTFGFDCAHLGDIVPCSFVGFRDSVYRGIPYVTEECRKLAVQLRQYEHWRIVEIKPTAVPPRSAEEVHKAAIDAVLQGRLPELTAEEERQYIASHKEVAINTLRQIR